MTAEAPKYRAFLSYSHRDGRWASWLHRRLEGYRVPKRLVGTRGSRGVVQARLVPVFRDREELATATDLSATITDALERSGALIVICSPAAAASRWVNEEILAFKRLGREDRIFPLIVDGEPNASDGGSDPGAECFPPALRFRLGPDGELSDRPTEPVAADAREGKDGRTGALLKLVAGLLGVGLDALRQREQQRRQRRLAVIAAASLGGMIVTTALAAAAWLARAEAERQRALAEIEATTARETTDFLVSLFEVSDPGEARGNTITAREILDRGARRIESDLAAQPAVQANLLHTMGRVYTGLGLYEPASRFLEQAVALRRELTEEPGPDVVASANTLGGALYLKGEYEAARAIYEEALGTARTLFADPHPELTRAMTGLADVHTQFANDAEAEALYREAIELDRSMHGDRHPDVARSLAGLANSLLFQGRFDEAEPLYRDALGIRVESLGDDHPLVAETSNNLASLYYFMGDKEAAEREYSETLRRYRHIYGDEHPETSSVINNLGRTLLELNRIAEAEPLLREALAVDRRLKDPQHDDLVFPLNSLGLALIGLDRPDEAHPLLEEALVIAERHDHRMRGPILSNLADLHCRSGRTADGLEAAEGAAPLLERDYADAAWRHANLASIRAGCLAADGRFAEAEILMRDALGPIEGYWGGDALFTSRAIGRLIALYEGWGKPGAAAALRARHGT